MNISTFDLFSIGVGPSSSHTVGPMRAARHFAVNFSTGAKAKDAASISIELYGSLAFTGKGHGTDLAICAGLEGALPESVDPELLRSALARALNAKKLVLAPRVVLDFGPGTFKFIQDRGLPLHSNGIAFAVFDRAGTEIERAIYYSVGGGFVVDEKGEPIQKNRRAGEAPYAFHSAADLLEICRREGIAIKDVILRNECAWLPESEVRDRLLQIWTVMNNCIESGLHAAGELPGGLKVKRRAAALRGKLASKMGSESDREFAVMDMLSVYAIAVNEENAAGGRVVTAPTNGAAGIIPAVLKYYVDHMKDASSAGVIDFLLTAAAIGMLYKKGASLSGAEVGCQGEVGVACSMAAAGLAAVQGGTNEQIENAAEIGMEHNLGLTCDPVGGLVQIPCIERNAMAAVKAVNAARLALLSDGVHVVSLDKVIATMKKTGEDMLTQYKETSQAGLAVTVTLPEC